MGRFHRDLDKASIKSWNIRSLFWEAGKRYSWNRNPVFGNQHSFIEVGRRFSICVREAVKQQPKLGSDSILFAYDTGALEAFEWCRDKGIRCVLDQMDPNRFEADLVREEQKNWPGWQKDSVQVPEEYFHRREQEWALADRIVVNSEFSRSALLKQGVPSDKLVVIPLCYEIDNGNSNVAGPNLPLRSGERARVSCSDSPSYSALSAPCSLLPAQPLRVLFLGQVILRKGIQYLIEAAKFLKDGNIHFDIVGPIGISKEAIASAPKNVTFHGRATRDQTAAWYQKSHVFVLPTISDGFAITQLEAMSYGLPVVTTPCCGDVVTDGVDGFIVPPRDSEALARVFQHYRKDPELFRNQSNAALAKSTQFSLAHLTENLLKLEASLLGI